MLHLHSSPILSFSVEGLELEDLDDMIPFDSDDVEDMFGDFGASFYEDYVKNVYKSVIAQFIVIGTHEIIITVPIPVSAQDPMSFDIRKAIMESKLFQELMKWSDLQEIINIWYKIRKVFRIMADQSKLSFLGPIRELELYFENRLKGCTLKTSW